MTDISDDDVWAMTTCLYLGDQQGIQDLWQQDPKHGATLMLSAAVRLGAAFRQTLAGSGIDPVVAWRAYREASQA